jgi:hypothetical protein
MDKDQHEALQVYKSNKKIYQQMRLEENMNSLILEIERFTILRDTNIETLEAEIKPLLHRVHGMLTHIECVKQDRKK